MVAEVGLTENMLLSQLILLITRAEFPWFMMVKVAVERELTVTVPISREVVDKVIYGAGAARPFPLTLTARVPSSLSLLVTVTVALWLSGATGVNATVTVKP